jgi:dUTP pyrophosphatase
MEENKVTETVINTDSIELDGIPIRVKYHTDTYALKYEGGEEKSNWIDLRCAEDIELEAGDFKLISLGASIELPKGYEAYLVPRSSTFKNYGILQTNGIGIIDTSYCGNEDVWKMPVYATRDTVIKKNERIAQFRIFERQPKLVFASTYDLENESRGGFGTSGVN